MKRNIFSLERKRSLSGYVFTAPWIIGFFIFMLYPLVMSFILSIGQIDEYRGLQTEIIGFQHYIDLFTKNSRFVPAILESVWDTFINAPLILVISLTISLLISRKLPGKGVFRLIFFLPVLLGTGYAMEQIGGAGNILEIPDNIGREIQFYFSRDIANFLEELLLSVISLFWRSGVQIIIFIGGIQAIPDTYYEAALVDNANSWDSLWKITLPMLSPMIFLNLVYTVIDSFRNIDSALTRLVIDRSMQYAEFESAAAMGWVYFAVAFAFVGMATLIFRRNVYYEK